MLTFPLVRKHGHPSCLLWPCIPLFFGRTRPLWTGLEATPTQRGWRVAGACSRSQPPWPPHLPFPGWTLHLQNYGWEIRLISNAFSISFSFSSSIFSGLQRKAPASLLPLVAVRTRRISESADKEISPNVYENMIVHVCLYCQEWLMHVM